jgi:UDP-glucose 4-epimerase
MPTALVTGGAGFIGSHLADRLLADGWRVVAFDNLAIGRRANVAHLDGDARFELIEGDIADGALLARIVSGAGVSAVFHLAAVHYIPFCTAHPFEAMRVNVLGTQAVIDAAASAGVGKIVFASTSDVYAAKDEPFVETDRVDPYTVYGTSKLFAERLLGLAVAARPELSVSVARFFNVYGPRETNPHVLPDIIEQVLRGDTAIRLGNTWPRRDFVYVEDVAAALVELARRSDPLDVFNVGTGTVSTIDAAVATVAGLVGRPLEVIADPARTRPVERGCLHADISKITRLTAWRPRWSFEDGLRAWLAGEGVSARLGQRSVPLAAE